VSFDEYMPKIYEGIKLWAESGEKRLYLSFVLNDLPYPLPEIEEQILNTLKSEGFKLKITRFYGLKISW
jgi:hypothetical protein